MPNLQDNVEEGEAVSQWRKARKKPVVVEFREVNPPFEEMMTLETKDSQHKFIAYPETDYIIRGVEGEIYACKKEIFWKTYELVEEPQKLRRGYWTQIIRRIAPGQETIIEEDIGVGVTVNRARNAVANAKWHSPDLHCWTERTPDGRVLIHLNRRGKP